MKRFLFHILLLSAGIRLYAQPEEPILMLHADMHSATINSIATDAKGQFLLTCSDDKTTRLWDASTGNRLRTFRPPVGYGNEGRLFACALSPDGNIAATGGQTGSSWNTGENIPITVGTRTLYVTKQQFSVYIFETTTGNMLAAIDGLDGEILDLKFTSDGKYLLAALGGSQGVSVIDTETWKRVRELTGYGGAACKMAFSSRGELAVVSGDGYIRIYDNAFRMKKVQTLPSGKELVSVDWSPQGNQLMVACADLNTVLVLNAETLRQTEMSIGSAITVKQPFVSVAYSSDGNRYAAGNHRSSNGFRIRSWQGDAVNMLGVSDFDVSQSNITALIALPDGSIVFCTSYPEIGRINRDSKSLVQWVTGNTRQTYVRAAEVTRYSSRQQKSFQVNDDGTVVGLYSMEKDVMFFSLTDRELKTAPTAYPVFNTRSDRTRVRISSWENSPTPLLNNRVLNFLEKDERSQCVDVMPSGERMLFGADKNIYCLDKDGEIAWKTPTIDRCAAVKITGNGQTAVAAFNDGTVCWYRMSDGGKLLTLFTHPDNRRWVLWTDAGFYDCAMGAEDLIGWHLNQDKNRESNFYPISQFRSLFFRPEVISAVFNLEMRQVAGTLPPTDPAFQESEKPVSIVEALPPDVSIISPRPESEISSQTVTIEYDVRLMNDDNLQSVKVLIDGRPVQLLTETQRGNNLVSVEIPQRDCEVTLIAKNSFGPSVPVSVSLKWKGTTEQEVYKPKLYILAVGVSQYDNANLRLQFAAKDASDFANAMKPQTGGLYDEVSIKLLTDKEATKTNILDGLDWLTRQTTGKDVAMLFIAGHGINDRLSSFFYMPVNADVENIHATCVSYIDIQKTVSSVAGKIIVYVDACHSGNVMAGSAQRGAVDLVGMVNELTDADNGAVVFTSSTGRQFSLEDESWNNGAFTKALVEGLLGKADLFNNNSISFKTLDAYIAQRVKVLTNGRQSPTTIIPQSMPDFQIAMTL